MIILPLIKTGNSFALPITISDANGVPEDITSWTVKMQGRSAGVAALADFSFTKTAPTQGRGEFGAAPAVTADWPIGPMLVDIKVLTPAGQVHSTETFQLTVERNIAT